MGEITKNDCQGEEPEGKKSIPVFLERTDKHLEENDGGWLDAEDVCRLWELANRFFNLDCQAASHVESVICMRSSHFTGEPPYTRWKGLGKALGEDYDELERLRSELKQARELIRVLADMEPSTLVEPGSDDDRYTLYLSKPGQAHEIHGDDIRRARTFLKDYEDV